jgi:aspartyl-tRNA(Asn)/glutamyl-tRNA(Gln) amidotransferase subunit A
MSLHFKTVTELAIGLRKKEFSSVELTQHFLDRIAKLDTQYNSFITVTPELALAQAKAADQRLANGDATVLTGIPIAQKDIFCTKDVKTTCGSKMLDNFIAPYDATVIEKFNAVGAIMLGKTNMDEFAMGSSNQTSYYGPVRNPWDPERVPGGSSGGAVAALAAGLAPLSTGTDTGGSIRQPAAYCNLTGLKPTYGVVSRFGMIAFASSLDQAGPLARTAEDCAIMLNAMVGFDERDSTSLEMPTTDYTAQLNDSLKGVKIGLPKEFFGQDADPAIMDLINAVAKQYEALGATLVEISLPNIGMSIPTYYVIAPAEASSNLARYDGVRYGYRCSNPKDLEDMYKRTRGEGFGAEVKRRIMIGTYVSSATHYDAFYLKAQKVRQLISQDYQAAFKQVDVILSPTAPNTAFKIGELMDDPIKMYLSDLYTAGTNLAGLPALSAPAGFLNKLPVGFQLIGNYFSEVKLFNMAHQYQQHTTWHTQTPEGL